MNAKLLIRSVTATAVCLVFGFLGIIALQDGLDSWYAALQKPWFTAPESFFGPVWTIMYILIGVSAGLVWSKGFYHKWVKTALYHFGFILLLNTFWFLFFFGLHEPLMALLAIISVFIVVLITIKWFKIVNAWSAYLLIPYAVWVLYLLAFTFEFWRIN
ncbi:MULTISPECIES: TspO/MBR family protein [unclassified Zunongwangia]|uniref:TspO/MBR family protein n=1 Tax=unclassified Zunongwangia TaxID=2632541 RepID=UPI0022DDD5EF|nr:MULTISPECIES: TspO/MBR family protein [unclassified Zunongwangia]WBL22830.1 tryptophan-rich sensory protein [Zunongwangia sp. HRR-M8]WBL25256.1 tryptophan-rich sensory protein [Zunongwangia sp. HGR-M22]